MFIFPAGSLLVFVFIVVENHQSVYRNNILNHPLNTTRGARENLTNVFWFLSFVKWIRFMNTESRIWLYPKMVRLFSGDETETRSW